MLYAFSKTFGITPQKGISAGGLGLPEERAAKIYGLLYTSVLFIIDEKTDLCLISSHSAIIGPAKAKFIKEGTSKILGINPNNVILFSSHNHCVNALTTIPDISYFQDVKVDESHFLPEFKEIATNIFKICREAKNRLEAVSVWYGLGFENRITYNRKGKREDGSTYFMREEDRQLLGNDFTGEIDADVPVVGLKTEDGSFLAFITQFTGHPVTAYHPEKPVVFGEWPTIACEDLAQRYSSDGLLSVHFLQGCAGNINSKKMLSGDIRKSIYFGHLLGQSMIKATEKMKLSKSNRLGHLVDNAQVPFAPLPSKKKLKREVEECQDFYKRAMTGDENTLSCVGLNFPKALTPRYRAKLIERLINWYNWALKIKGTNEKLPQYLALPVHTIRIGDAAIVGLACEPFVEIGKLIKKLSPFDLTIPCGYTDMSYGYIPDSSNCGDKEYMSSFYRYTKYYPPYGKPAGDTIAYKAEEMLNKLV